MTDAATPPTLEAPPKRDSIPRWIIPLVLAALILVAAVAIVIIAGRRGGIDAPPQPAPFVLDSPLGADYASFDVRQVNGETITVSSLTTAEDVVIEFQLSPNARLELLDNATFEEIEVGHWVTVVGIPNEVFNFSITSVVVMPEFELSTANLARTPGGFFGHEAALGVAKDDVLRPILGGVVLSIGDDRIVTLSGPDGDITVTLLEEVAPLFILREATVADIQSGDRLAVGASAAADLGNAGSVLVTRPLVDLSLLGAEGLGVGSAPEDAGGED